jgi:cytochrome c-type biogenesis protein CcmH/NrfF
MGKPQAGTMDARFGFLVVAQPEMTEITPGIWAYRTKGHEKLLLGIGVTGVITKRKRWKGLA